MSFDFSKAFPFVQSYGSQPSVNIKSVIDAGHIIEPLGRLFIAFL
jgi:hypothetical protein